MAQLRRTPLACGLNAGAFLTFASGAGVAYVVLAVQGSRDRGHPGQAGLVWYGRGVGLVALALTAGGLVNLYRCFVAWRQKQRLADPSRAASVPPLQRHAVTTRERVRRRRDAVKGIGYLFVAVVLLLSGLVGHSVTVAVVAVLLCALFLASIWRDLAVWRRIRYVERTSNRPVQTVREPDPLTRQTLVRPPLEVVLWPPVLSQPLPSMGTALRGLRTLPRDLKPILAELSKGPGLLGGIRELSQDRNFAGRVPLQIGYFRLFDNDPGVDPVWAKYGYVHLLRSSASISRDEVDRMKKSPAAGTVFITSAEQLARDISWRPSQIGYAYPVRALLCHSRFWKTAVDLLLPMLDLVFVSLSGYHHQLHEGTGWELQRIIDRIPVQRVVLLTDSLASLPYLQAQVQQAWSRMADGSPNASPGSRTILAIPMNRKRVIGGTYTLFDYLYKRLDHEKPR